MRTYGFSFLIGANFVASLSIRGFSFYPSCGNSPSLLEKRAATNGIASGRCGPSYGNCNEGNCCSAAGYCGVTSAHCISPECQIDFGRCDASKTPYGTTTAAIPRPHRGRAPYAPSIISECVIPGTVALTFDDGPYWYTDDLLNLLDKYNAKSTFFVTGINLGKGPIDDPDLPWRSMILRMQRSGHQVGSHTWSHQDLSRASRLQIREEMLKIEAALRNILGYIPTYMRPPYSSCSLEGGCLEIMDELGYRVILYDIDTKDYENDSPGKIQKSKDKFDRVVASSSPTSDSWLPIVHDIHEQTAHNLTEHLLRRILDGGYRAVTVGDCLGDPKEFWYRKDDSFAMQHGQAGYENQPRPPTAISVDGTCGKNFTCLNSSFGDCCSGSSYCGNSTVYCGMDCQPLLGRCNNSLVPGSLPESHSSEPSPGDDSQQPERVQRKSKSEAHSVPRMSMTLPLAELMAVSAVMMLF